MTFPRNGTLKSNLLMSNNVFRQAMHVRDRAALEMPLLRDQSNDLTNQCFASLRFFTSSHEETTLCDALLPQVHCT